MSEERETQFKYEVKELDIISVTVYKDQAEVKRSIKLSPTPGEAEVLVHGLSSRCDLDSIRVQGKGNATITEVISLEKLEEKAEVDESQVKSLQDQISEIEKEIAVLTAEKERISKHCTIIIGLGDHLKDPSSVNKKKDIKSSLLTDEGLNGVVRFMNLYGEQLKHCDEETFRLDGEIKKHRSKISVLKNKCIETSNVDVKTTRVDAVWDRPWTTTPLLKTRQQLGELDALRQILTMNRKIPTLPRTVRECYWSTKQVSVLLDVKEAGELQLAVSYLVTGAKWLPKYDIRAFSEDSVVKISYFALITQLTGEDWDDAKLFLSTAQPSVGGDPPQLPSQTVNFNRYGGPINRTKGRGLGMGISLKRQTSKLRRRTSYDKFEDDDLSNSIPGSMSDMEMQTSGVQSGALSTTFDVARRSTIPSDKTEHKVVVAMFDLKSVFQHYSIPKKVANAYLKAKLVNESPYMILAGPCSVFMDNNFITKSTLPDVNPSENFQCSLGVDFAVRITYKPCNKNQESAGVFGKTQVHRYKQAIEVKNTHRHDIRIEVEDQLPRSEDQKIKVSLIEPVLPKDKTVPADAPVSMNKNGNIVWKSWIKASSTESYVLHYTIEKPHGKAIEFNEVS